MPKKEYIERVALIKFAMDYIPNIHGDTTMKAVKRALKAAPAADDVVEVRHGEWISIIDEPTPLREFALLSGYQCSECGRYEKEKQPYCNCGAKMDGERKEQT